MSMIINDPDAGEYYGYVIIGMESEEEIEARYLRNRDEAYGVYNPKAECTCDVMIAGDHISAQSCRRHGIKSFTVTECCYCSGECCCRWSTLDKRQRKLACAV